MNNIFTKHPHKIGETYFEHFLNAVKIGGTMVFGGGACLIHAFFPFLFEFTASNAVKKLVEILEQRANKN